MQRQFVDVAEKLPVFVYDVDTLARRVSNQDSTLAVGRDAPWFERPLTCSERSHTWSERALYGTKMTGVCKAEIASLVNHHNCTGGIVRHADIQVPVLTEVFINAAT